MNSFAVVAFLAAIAAANASILAPAAKILQGPSSRTTLIGPEGSVISSAAPGGQVITEEAPGVVAYSAPVVAAPATLIATHAVPLAYSAPVVASPLVPRTALNTVVAGPSGIIATSRGLIAAGHW